MRPFSLAFLAILILAATGCSAAAASSPQTPAAPPITTAGTASSPQPATAPFAKSGTAAAFPQSITDDAGRQITLPTQPRRIVSLSASNTEILFALGLEDRVVGVNQYSDFPPSAKNKPQVGSFAKPDLERIVAQEPDLILATEMHVKTIVPDLERRGLQVLVVDPKDTMGVLNGIQLMGRATGQQQEADALAERMRARIEEVTTSLQGTEPVRVFFELSPALHTAGPGSFVDDVIRLAGGTNIAAGAGKQWPQLNQESLFLADPQVILLADHTAGETPEMVAARPGWREISAVKDGRIVVVDPNLVNRPGPRVAQGLELIAGIIHPEKVK